MTKLSIIIPIYNEEKTITQILDKVLSYRLPPPVLPGNYCRQRLLY